jgi:RNA polymerase-interacting CarD/CdnL/TRCF family regulator
MVGQKSRQPVRARPVGKAKPAAMDFREGDPVIHWMYGLGRVLRVEQKDLSGGACLYYVVQIKDMTVWVPVDEELKHRLRPPTPKSRFSELLDILTGESQPLPIDRFDRKAHLQAELKEASAQANCRLIRDLTALQEIHALNDHDLLILNRTRASLLGEWTCSRGVSLPQAESELGKLVEQGKRTHAKSV